MKKYIRFTLPKDLTLASPIWGSLNLSQDEISQFEGTHGGRTPAEGYFVSHWPQLLEGSAFRTKKNSAGFFTLGKISSPPGTSVSPVK